MISVKVKFRSSTVAGKEGALYYQVICCRQVKQINPHLKVFREEWNGSRIQAGYATDERRNRYLASVQEKLDRDLRLLEYIIVRFRERKAGCSADEIVSAFAHAGDGGRLFPFMNELIVKFRQTGKFRTSETYACALKSFMRFRHDRDIEFSRIDSLLIRDYEAALKQQGLTWNTVSFYLRILRAVYNRAVEQGLTDQRFPFKSVYTGVEKTVKRAIPLSVMKRLKALDLTLHPALDYARDLFLFSFYMRGMAFVDMAFLRKKDLNGRVLSYRRKKTGRLLCIRWEPCMQQLVDKYSDRTAGSPYLLPIIRPEKGNDEREQYKNAILNTNKNLKKLARRMELPVPLTTYVARHTWASIARAKNIPLSVISEGMGHESENTTRIYLVSLDVGVIDKANRLILRELK